MSVQCWSRKEFFINLAFPFFFDSGAECSLIKEKLAVKLAGKRSNNLVILKGIGTNVPIVIYKYCPPYNARVRLLNSAEGVLYFSCTAVS